MNLSPDWVEVFEQAGWQAVHWSNTGDVKIRTAQMQKMPYMLVVGDREEEANAVAVRHRNGEDLGTMPLDKFMARLGEESEIPKG